MSLLFQPCQGKCPDTGQRQPFCCFSELTGAVLLLCIFQDRCVCSGLRKPVFELVSCKLTLRGFLPCNRAARELLQQFVAPRDRQSDYHKRSRPSKTDVPAL